MTVDERAVAACAEASPLRRVGTLSDHADLEELRFREEIESYPQPLRDVPAFIERNELPHKLRHALAQARLAPAGDIVELGAGTCWMAAELAKRPAVRRVIGVEFSARRLTDLAPIAIAYLGAPAEKIERCVADFYDHGLGEEIADFVITDAAFHHASDPVSLARVAWSLLRPGGLFVLFREPTIALLRRGRDHREEGKHGSFEHEYTARGYFEHLRAAGFVPSKHPASGGWRTPRARAILRPPLSWLNGIAFAEYTYVGRRPER